MVNKLVASDIGICHIFNKNSLSTKEGATSKASKRRNLYKWIGRGKSNINSSLNPWGVSRASQKVVFRLAGCFQASGSKFNPLVHVCKSVSVGLIIPIKENNGFIRLVTSTILNVFVYSKSFSLPGACRKNRIGIGHRTSQRLAGGNWEIAGSIAEINCCICSIKPHKYCRTGTAAPGRDRFSSNKTGCGQSSGDRIINCGNNNPGSISRDQILLILARGTCGTASLTRKVVRRGKGGCSRLDKLKVVRAGTNDGNNTSFCRV